VTNITVAFRDFKGLRVFGGDAFTTDQGIMMRHGTALRRARRRCCIVLARGTTRGAPAGVRCCARCCAARGCPVRRRAGVNAAAAAGRAPLRRGGTAAGPQGSGTAGAAIGARPCAWRSLAQPPRCARHSRRAATPGTAPPLAPGIVCRHRVRGHPRIPRAPPALAYC